MSVERALEWAALILTVIVALAALGYGIAASGTIPR